jgi:hypothetical protein
MDLLIFYIPAIIIFGIITSYEDWKEKKIRNKWIALALIYSLLVFAITAYSAYSQLRLEKFYVSEYFLNIFLALFSGVLIWFAGLWTAGDAKLFLAYSALIPLSVYQWGYILHFPSFIILVNTFAPYFLFYFVVILFNTSSGEKMEIIKEMFKPKIFFNFLLFVFAFYSVISYVSKYLDILSNLFVVIFLLFMILFFFKQILRIEYLHVAIILSIVGLVIDFKGIFTIYFLKNFLLILFLFIFIRYFVLHLAFRLFSLPINIEDLKEDMIPAENVVHQKGGYIKRKIVPLDFIGGLLDRTEGKPLFKELAKGMTEKEIKQVKKLHSQGEIKDHTIRIYKTLSFAPFMFAGVLLTIAVRGSFFVYLKMLIENFI